MKGDFDEGGKKYDLDFAFGRSCGQWVYNAVFWRYGRTFFALSLVPYTVLGFANKHSPSHWFGRSVLLVTTLIVTVGGIVAAAGIAGQLHKDALGAVGFVFLPMYQTAVAVLGVVIMWVGTQITT